MGEDYMNNKIKKLWIQNLRSKTYTQTYDEFKKTARCYCTLGILYNLYFKTKKKRWNISNMADIRKIREWSGITIQQENTIIYLNDHKRYTFNQMAEYIHNNL